MQANPKNTMKVCFNKYDSVLVVLLYASVPMELYTTKMLRSESAKTTAQITLSPCRFLSTHSFILLNFIAKNLEYRI